MLNSFRLCLWNRHWLELRLYVASRDFGLLQIRVSQTTWSKGGLGSSVLIIRLVIFHDKVSSGEEDSSVADNCSYRHFPSS